MCEGAGLLAEAGIGPLRDKGMRLTGYLIEPADAWLAPLGFRLASPRDAARRGSHICLYHPEAVQLNEALIEAGVIGDSGPRTGSGWDRRRSPAASPTSGTPPTSSAGSPPAGRPAARAAARRFSRTGCPRGGYSHSMVPGRLAGHVEHDPVDLGAPRW